MEYRRLLGNKTNKEPERIVKSIYVYHSEFLIQILEYG